MNVLFVIKLGGSFATGGRLRTWLDALRGGAGRAVLVPGGGPFVDAVRMAQTSMGFDDATAHRLALAAMRQYGLALAALEPQLMPVASHRAVRAALLARRVPVWLPEAMVLRDPAIAASWDVTSDSLALWLAQRLQAGALVLVKQVRPEPDTATQFSQQGFVDRAFPRYFAQCAVPTHIAGPDDAQALGAALRTGHIEGLVSVLPDSMPGTKQ